MDTPEQGPGHPQPQFQLETGAKDTMDNQECFYENTGFIPRTKDPFGTDFENALKKGDVLKVKKLSISSNDRESNEGESDIMLPGMGETPPLPGKKFSRSSSRTSRHSSISDSKSSSLPRQRYDEVGLSTNFGKPVILDQPETNPLVDNIFESITFDSPLQNLSPGTIDSFKSTPSKNSAETLSESKSELSPENKMNSIDSTVSIASSKNVVQNLARQFSEDSAEDPYEDIELIHRTLAAEERLSAPEPPPRNSILKPLTVFEELDEDKDALKKDNQTEKLYEENIYNICDTSGDSGKSANLMDNPIEEEHNGARPKIMQSRLTIDIRSKISQWYEEAEKEVERDLSLDISQLEKMAKNSPQPKMRTKFKPSYEHISLATTGKPTLEGEEIFPKPTMTLLRDFDPCFDEEPSEEESSKKTESDSEPSESEMKKVPNKKEISNKLSAPVPLPRSKFKIGTKKINFGPPKPPRNFNFATLDKSDDEEINHQPNLSSSTKHSKTRDIKNCDKEKDPLKKETKSDQAQRADENVYVTFPPRFSKETLHYESSPDNSPRPPASPPPPLPNSSPPPLPASSPPPLPHSLPPPIPKSKHTMYENVWVEPISGQVSLEKQAPPVPPRPIERNKCVSPSPSKEIVCSKSKEASPKSDTETAFKVKAFGNLGGRKYSQESLNKSKNNSLDSTDSPPKITLHKKSESIDSSSSASLSVCSDSLKVQDKDDVSSTDNAIAALSSDSGDLKKQKKKLSGRSFTVGNLAPRLSKLPEMASSLKRRMTDIKPSGINGGRPASTFLTADSPNLTENEHEPTTEEEFATRTKRNSFLMSEGLKPGTKNQTGALYILSRSKKVFQCKWCVLGHGNFRWFNEQFSLAIPKETILLSNILSVTKRSEKHFGPTQQDLYCFDLAVLNSKGKHTVFLIGALTAHERDVWLEKIVQSLSYKLSSFSMSECSRLGWAQVKPGFASDWGLAWLSLSTRYLYYTTDDTDMDRIDLKKTKDIFLRKDSKNLNLPPEFSKNPVLVCDFNDRSLYILLGSEKECLSWQAHIEEIAFCNSNVLSEQQVTQEDVPVIVDKCIKFVYSQGVMTEGIYRLAGVNTKINRLLSEFRNNAWSVQISREDYSEHDVANVLKRFIRQLKEPLLTENLRATWMKTAEIEDLEEKLNRYRELLSRIPVINYNTLRRLIAHLYVVADQCEKNLMPVYNLSPLWGPTLLTVDGQEANMFAQTTGEMEVCADLITNYPWLFNVDMEEVEKERKMLAVLEKINFPDQHSVKRSGDIRMWIYIESRTQGECVSLLARPQLTAGQALRQAVEEAKISSDRVENLLIHEVVLGGTLERPLHHSEKMLDVTLRWGTWAEADRHDNYLLLKENQFYNEAIPCAIPPLSVFAEVLFSDNKPKSKFVSFLFSVSKASITYYKEEKSGIPTELGAWPVEEVNWYIGCEPKRGAPYNLNLTITPKNEPIRSKEQPLFGRVMSFQSRELFIKWIAALLVAEYPNDLVPPPSLVLID